MRKVKKNKDIVEYYSEKTQELAYSVNEKTKKISYFVFKEQDSNRKNFKKIMFEGFDALPAGFYADGYGITTGGYLFIKKLFNEFEEPISLLISKTKKSNIRKLRKGTKITFNYKEFRTIQRRLQEIKKLRNLESDNATQYFFSRIFPDIFDEPDEVDESQYQENQIVNTLNKHDIKELLSKEDIKALDEFYPTFIDIKSKKFKGDKKLFQIVKSKNQTEIIYLENIIEDFQKKLNRNLREGTWQEFLSKYILLFNTNYTDVIEKTNISLISGKYPDFMLIDVYNYLDIYEIKKPQTNLLKFDKSRNNYYWDIELSKAISQVENYKHTINRNSSSFKEDIRINKGIDVRVVKPRGFIIAGKSDQFKHNEKMENDFRLLNYSLKNVEVILYDELLNNLRIFLKRLKTN